MKHLNRLIALTLAALLALTLGSAGALAEESKLFGGNGDDVATGFILLADGGYLVYGATTSTDGPFRRSEGMGGGRVPWAMCVDRSLEVRWHFLMPNEEGAFGTVRHAAELENGQIALLIERIDDEDTSELVLLGKARDILRQETLDLRDGKISAVSGGVAACGRGSLEDSGDPCLTVAHLFFDQDELDFYDNGSFDVQQCTAAFTTKQGLWMLTDVKLPNSKQIATIVFCLSDSGTSKDLFHNKWSHKSLDLPSLGMWPDEDGVFISVKLPKENAIDKTQPAWDWMKDDTGRVKTCLFYAPGRLMAMPYAHADESYAFLGYEGSEGGRNAYMPKSGDKGFVYYRNHATGVMYTFTRSNTQGGIRFVDGIWEATAMKVLGNQGSSDKKCQVLIVEWDKFAE